MNAKQLIYYPNQSESVIMQPSLLDRYIAYTSKEEANRIYWFMKTIIFMPSVYTVISVFALASMTDNFVWLIALSMVLFFVNVMVHTAEKSGLVFISTYYLSIFILILVPLMTYFLI